MSERQNVWNMRILFTNGGQYIDILWPDRKQATDALDEWQESRSANGLSEQPIRWDALSSHADRRPCSVVFIPDQIQAIAISEY